jgi:GGDEF domain-containing protein
MKMTRLHCWHLACLFLSALLFWAPARSAMPPLGEPTIVHNSLSSKYLSGASKVWYEPGREASVEKAFWSAQWQDHTAGTPFFLNAENSVWILLHVARAPGESGNWMLDIPIPFIDSISVFQRDATGRWTEQVAGDTLAHDQWSHQSVTPAFRLRLAEDQPSPVVLRVRNYATADIPIRLSREDVHAEREFRELLVLGWMLGLLLTFAVLSFVRHLEYRYPSDFAAMVYTLLVAVTVAQVNGVLGATLLQSLPVIANYGSKVIATIAVGGSLIYMRELYALSIHFHRFDRLMAWTGWFAVIFAFANLIMRPSNVATLEVLVYITASGMSVIAAFLSWRAGSTIWHWIMLATVPQGLCIVWLAMENLGVVFPRWEVRYVTSFFIAVSVPVLAYALSLITRDRKDRIQRARQLDTQDALTGLLNRTAFERVLRKAMGRVHRDQEPVAMALVQLANHQQIVETYGQAIGEQCELRAVVKLHRVLRDVDPAGRLGTATFALLLKGLRSREQLNSRMVKLLASGLTPQPGLQPPVLLQFHAACVLLHEQHLDADQAILELSSILADIRPGTRRPIRFIEAVKTQPVESSGMQQTLKDLNIPAD